MVRLERLAQYEADFYSEKELYKKFESYNQNILSILEKYHSVDELSVHSGAKSGSCC